LSPPPFTARRFAYRRAVWLFASAGSVDASQAKIETDDDIGSVGFGLMIESPAIATEMTGWFDEIAEQAAFQVKIGRNHNGHERLRWYRQRNGKQEVYTTEPNTSFWCRLGVNLMQLLPIESQL
jgi:hypothetical protein